MPEEPSAAPTTHDTETLTDGVEIPATEDAEVSEPATDRKFTFLSRHISTLRALRLGGVFTVLTAIVLAIVWWVQLTLLWGITFPFFLFFPGLLPWLIGAPLLWAFGSQLETLKRTFAAITTVCIVVTVGVMGQHWWLIHEQTFNWSGLFQALLISGLGVFIVSDVLLRGIRTHQNIPPGDPDDPARYRPKKHNTLHTSRRWVTLLRRIALALAPVTAAATAIALIQASTAPINHTAPPPEGPLPERSTGIGTTLAWTKEVPGLLATASGAAGPVILTSEGLTGLNPTNGTTLWTYHRKNTEYAWIVDLPPGKEEFSYGLSGSYLVSSPNGRYVALRIRTPEELVEKPKSPNATGTSTIREPINNAMTVVVDTLTGHATNEHPSNINWNLQLTDSALLDGTTAYNLDDGKVRWNLKPLTKESGSDRPSDYSGPAGHKSFILDRDPDEKYHRQQCMSKSLPLISDTDPTEITTAENIAVDNLTCYPVIVGGRTAQYTSSPVIENNVVLAQETRVVTLDSLAGLEEMKPIDMGKTIGLNGTASRVSGTLAAYPVPEDGKMKFHHDSVKDFSRREPTVGTVFDPTTGTTIPAGQYPGLAAASVGIAPAVHDETLLTEVVMKPGDGSAEASFPLDSRGFPQPPEEMPKDDRLIPAQLSARAGRENVNVINAPGTTLVTLKTNDLDSFLSSDRYATKRDRLYGLTGDAS